MEYSVCRGGGGAEPLVQFGRIHQRNNFVKLLKYTDGL